MPLVLIAAAELFIRWRRRVLDLPRAVPQVWVAYEFSVALRAGCALMPRIVLAHAVPTGLENPLAALRAAEIDVRSHAHERGYARRTECAAGLSPAEHSARVLPLRQLAD